MVAMKAVCVCARTYLHRTTRLDQKQTKERRYRIGYQHGLDKKRKSGEGSLKEKGGKDERKNMYMSTVMYIYNDVHMCLKILNIKN